MPAPPISKIDPEQFYHLMMMLRSIQRAVAATSTLSLEGVSITQTATDADACVEWAETQLG